MVTHGQIFNTMVAFFEEDEWDFHWLEDRPVLSMNFSGKNGKWTCYAQAREEQEQFVFYSVCPINVPDSRRGKVAEFLTRANYGMIIGNFEMDYNDGEVRYKTSIDVEGDSLSHALMKQMVYANVIIMDRYLPGILSMIYGEQTPLDTIQHIEGFAASGDTYSTDHNARDDHRPGNLGSDETGDQDDDDIDDLPDDDSDNILDDLSPE